MEKNITAKIVFDVENIKKADEIFKKMLTVLSSKELSLISDCKLTNTIMEVDSSILATEDEAKK